MKTLYVAVGGGGVAERSTIGHYQNAGLNFSYRNLDD